MIHNDGWTNRQLLVLLVSLMIVPILVFLQLDPKSSRETLIFVIALAVSYILGCSLLVLSNRAVERRLAKPDRSPTDAASSPLVEERMRSEQENDSK